MLAHGQAYYSCPCIYSASPGVLPGEDFIYVSSERGSVSSFVANGYLIGSIPRANERRLRPTPNSDLLSAAKYAITIAFPFAAPIHQLVHARFPWPLLPAKGTYPRERAVLSKDRAMATSTLALSVPLDQCTLDQRLQMRTTLNFEVVEEYANVIDSLPPCRAIRIGEHYWITDGWHTYHAHKRAGRTEITLTYREGTFIDALVEAAGANYTHGMRRTYDDKRRAVRALLAEPSWSSRSDRSIALACHVHHELVGNVRREIGSPDDQTTYRETANKTGKSTGGTATSNSIQGSSNGKATNLYTGADDIPYDTEPEPAKRTSKDGKMRPATQPARKKNKPTSEDDVPGEETEPDEMVDEAGYSVPAKLRLIFAEREILRSAQAVISKSIAKLKEVEDLQTYKQDSQPGRIQLSSVLSNGAMRIRGMEPHTVHQKCKGNGCKDCESKGYLSVGDVKDGWK